ncbi:hypothetical protein ACJX0J_013203 [Zea mays]
MKLLLFAFEQASGLKINFHNSEVNAQLAKWDIMWQPKDQGGLSILEHKSITICALLIDYFRVLSETKRGVISAILLQSHVMLEVSCLVSTIMLINGTKCSNI